MKWEGGGYPIETKENTLSSPASRKFGLTNQVIIYKQSDLLGNNRNLFTVHDSLQYVSKYLAT